MSAMALLTSQVKVRDTSNAVAMVTDSPGIAPTNSPAREPRETNIMKFKSMTASVSRIKISAPHGFNMLIYGKNTSRRSPNIYCISKGIIIEIAANSHHFLSPKIIKNKNM